VLSSFSLKLVVIIHIRFWILSGIDERTIS
jgi:hypothetical protein